MRVKLLRDARINHKAGEIVTVSPEQGLFLQSTGSAEVIVEKAVKEPEEIAEKAVKAPKATTTGRRSAKKKM